MTFDEFCSRLAVTTGERESLVMYLAVFRATETIRTLSIAKQAAKGGGS